MYGVSKDLPLERFVGDAVVQVRIGRDGVQFVFDRSGTIAIEGRWEIVDSTGTLVDHDEGYARRESYRVHVLLNADVTGLSLDPPRSFSFTLRVAIDSSCTMTRVTSRSTSTQMTSTFEITRRFLR